MAACLGDAAGGPAAAAVQAHGPGGDGGWRPDGGVVAQVWRGGTGRQASLARLLAGVEVVPIDGILGRRAGVLLGRGGATDVVDACVVLLAADGDDVITSDPDDLRSLAVAAGVHIELIPA